MSIAKMHGDAWTYYSKEVATSAEDYYLGVGEEPGWWWGSQAEAWGLDGQRVGDDELRRVFAGLDPHTGDQLGRAFGTRSVNGIAAAFSAPKSVSLLWALGDEQTAAAVRAAHKAAYVEALEYLEANACLTRIGAAGRHQVDAQGFAVAVFEHRTSRLADPQLHAHALIATKVRDGDGYWLSADTNEIYANVRTAGTLYQSALRAGLTESLGVAWGPTNGHGQADVAGIEPELVGAFSKRRAQVEMAIDGWVAEGIASERLPADYEPTRADYQRATLTSRPAKDHSVGPDTLRGLWRQEASELGWSAERLRDDVLGQCAHTPAIRPRQLAEEVLGELVAHDATFAPRHVVREVAARVDAHRDVVEDLAAKVLADRRSVSLAAPADAELGVESLRADGRPTWLHRRHDRWTTTAQLQLEATVLDYAAAPITAGLVGDAAHQAAVSSRNLDVDQVAAVSHLLTSGRPVDVVVSGAGTGKSHALGAAAAGWEAEGYRVVAMAPRGGAAAVMRSEGLARADTVAKYLSEWSSDHPASGYALRRGDVVVVDEAGSLGTRDLAKVVEGARAVEAKVVLVGDHRQLGSVEAGGLFAHLAAGDDVATLERVHRQREEWERTAAQGLRAREVSSLDAYDAHGRLHAGDRAEMTEAVFSAWAADRAEGVDSLMLAGRRVDVATINARAHDHRVATGAVKPGGLAVGDQLIGVGDVVLTTSPDRRQVASNGRWVLNGDRWAVDAIGSDGSLAVTHLDHGGSLRLPAEYVVDHVGLGYAATVHRAQGTTTERCHLLADLRLLANHLYVALTRGRGSNHAYVILDELAPDHECEPGAPEAPEPLTARDALAEVLRRSETDVAAHTVLRDGIAARAAAHPTPEGAPEPEPGPPSPWRRGDQHEVGGGSDGRPGVERESAVAAAMRHRQEQERSAHQVGRDRGWGR